jgi:hypothetical protein
MRITKTFLNEHKYCASLGAFILTGNTLSILLDKTDTPIEWLGKKLDANNKVFVDLIDLKDSPLSRILTISILDALTQRFDSRGKIKKLPATQ